MRAPSREARGLCRDRIWCGYLNQYPGHLFAPNRTDLFRLQGISAPRLRLRRVIAIETQYQFLHFDAHLLVQTRPHPNSM
jgi:hypothetical protein